MNPTPLDDVVSFLVVKALRRELPAALDAAIERSLPELLRRAGLPDYMSRSEAADYIGRSIRSLDHIRASGKLPWTKRGGRVMLKTADLDAYLDEGRVDSRGRG